MEDWLATAEPPRFADVFPGQFDAALAAEGAPVYARDCAACHGASGRDFSGAYVGKVTPIAEIATDRGRLDNYTRDLAVNQNLLYADLRRRALPDLPQDRRLRQRPARRPLAARALPARRLGPDAGGAALAAGRAPARLPARLRRLRPAAPWASSATPRDIDPAVWPRLFCYVTTAAAAADFARPECRRENGACADGPCRGNGNGGHLYGTALPRRGEAGADRISQDLLRESRDGQAQRRPLVHRRPHRRGALVLVAAVGGVYVWYKAFRTVPQEICGDVEPSRRADLCADPAEERFKYGSLGAEADLGIPYPIFHVLPRVFGDLMPGPGGYAAFGIPWEEGRELPVGFSKKTMGFPRITQTCAICHAASYRTAPDAKPGDRAHRPLAHHQRHGLPRLPRGRRQRSALVRATA